MEVVDIQAQLHEPDLPTRREGSLPSINTALAAIYSKQGWVNIKCLKATKILLQLVRVEGEMNRTLPKTSFRGWFREPSGTFRNSIKMQLCYKLPDKLPETFRELPEVQPNGKIQNKLPAMLPETFRNLPDLRKFGYVRFQTTLNDPTCKTQLVNVYYFFLHGGF